MLPLTDPSSVSQPARRHCPDCGAAHLPDDACDTERYRPLARTAPLNRPPSTLPNGAASEGGGRFTENACVMLQFLPSGDCHSLMLHHPTVLGRGPVRGNKEALLVAEHNAYQHGVSRQHCLLQRQGDTLLVTDLDSTNGTYLNGHRLFPFQVNEVMDGDHLSLGSLHVIVFFSYFD